MDSIGAATFGPDSFASGRLRRGAALVTLALLSLCAGCVKNSYEIEMSVDGKSLHRRLVVSSSRGEGEAPSRPGLAPAEIERLAGLYAAPVPPESTEPLEFEGTFEGSTPADVGGAGSLTVWSSRLGTTSAYLERFRGSDDLVDTLDRRRNEIDELSQLIKVWLRTELQSNPDAARILAYVDGRFSHDLQNLAAYVRAGSMAAEIDPSRDASGDIGHELQMRLAQYFVERGDLSIHELPSLIQMASGATDELRLSALRSILESRLGHPLSGPEWFFLESRESLKLTINTALRSDPRYIAFVAEWNRAHPGEPRSRGPQPTDMLMVKATRGFGLYRSSWDRVQVTLHCPARPFRTNGKWNADAKTLAWNGSVELPGESVNTTLPVFAFARWSTPDESFQRQHFGRVVIADEQLEALCYWEATLSPPQLEEWQHFAADLQPNAELVDAVSEFRFSTERDSASPPVVSDSLRNLLLPALDAQADEVRETAQSPRLDVVLEGLLNSRERLRSGVFRAHGRKRDGIDGSDLVPTYEGDVELYGAFDDDR